MTFLQAHHPLVWALIVYAILVAAILGVWWVWDRTALAHQRRADRRFYAQLAEYQAAKRATSELPLLPPSEFHNV